MVMSTTFAIPDSLGSHRYVCMDVDVTERHRAESALRTALVEAMGLKPRLAFGPVRVAVTGRRISPPLFESLDLLGRERSLAPLSSALA